MFDKNDKNKRVRHYKLDDLLFPIKPFLRFLGFYVAEGYAYKKPDQPRANNIAVAFNGITEDDMIRKLLTDIGLPIIIYKKKNNPACAVANIYNTTLAEWLLKECGHLAWNKKVPDFIKELPPDYIEEFLTYLFIGDGRQAETSNILTTTSKQLSDEVQELLLKCGYAFRERFRDVNIKNKNLKKKGVINGREICSKRDFYEINWLKKTEIEIDNSKVKNTKSFKEEWIDYDGFVYCVTVPNGIIYIRRNGKGLWCGNSLRVYTNCYTEEIQEIIDKYEYLSENICIKCGKPDVKQITKGWIYPICFDCYSHRSTNVDQQMKLYREATEGSTDTMADSYTIRRFNKDGSSEHTYDISETANAIRKRYERRMKHRG